MGDYSVDEFNALIANATTNNASFSLLLVFEDASLNPRRVALWDGLLTMHNQGNANLSVTLSGLDIDNPAEGDLTWYVMEGDVGGSMGEQVTVTSQPSGATTALSDGVNPVDNPMNHTINTTASVQTDSLGVDIDKFSIDGVLSSTDTAVQIDYAAGDDKWWIAYNVVGVNVFEPAFGAGSGKSWTLHDDADTDQQPTAGDTIRYTIQLVNTGTAVGVVSVTDAIPIEASSWQLIDAAGGSDASNANTLVVNGITVAAGASKDVVFDVVIDAAPGRNADGQHGLV